jgi:hypothetical protein
MKIVRNLARDHGMHGMHGMRDMRAGCHGAAQQKPDHDR